MTTLHQESIALDKLIPWSGNVRKTGIETALDELTASIASHGLLNPLTVRKAPKGKYAVVAGQRRLKALQSLAKAGSLTKAEPIACQIIDAEANAAELSLAENVVRVAMHPADQFEAWRGLVEQGCPVHEIASRFGVTEPTVRKRLALASVSPVLFAVYRDGGMSLEALQAFTVSADHEAQESVWQSLSGWERDNPSTIRRVLTRDDIASTDARVRLIGLDAYEAAGGAVRRDLFDAGSGGYVQDLALLDRLVRERLKQVEAEVKAEGWLWTESRPRFDGEDFDKARPEIVELTDALQEEADSLEAEADALDGDGPDAQERLDAIHKRLDEIDAARCVWPDAVKAKAGAVVYLSYDGSIEIERGLMRSCDADKAAPVPEGAERAPKKDKPVGLPASLIEDLTASKTAALRAELAQAPALALALVTHAMLLSAFYHVPQGILKAGLVHRSLRSSLRDHDECKAVAALEAERTRILDRLPGDPGDVLAWCLTALQDDLLDALAVAVAHGLDAVTGKNDPNWRGAAEGAALTQALRLDMAGWYAPTAEGYFGRISKAAILADLVEARGKPCAPSWEKMKKGDLAALAEREVAATGWLPEPLR